MKKTIVILAAMAILFVSGTAAVANDTATVAVTATVVGTCKFVNKSGSISFGNLDPSVGGDVSGVVKQPTFWCTKNAGYTITDDNGLNESGTTYQMKHASLADVIPYSFVYTATGTGSGPGTPITMNITSTVLSADYLNVAAGSYSDTVTLTINP